MKKIADLFVLFLFFILGFFIFFVEAEFDDMYYGGMNDEKGFEGLKRNNLDQQDNQNGEIIDTNLDGGLYGDVDGKGLSIGKSELSSLTKGNSLRNGLSFVNVTYDLQGGYWVEDNTTHQKTVEFQIGENGLIGTTDRRTPSKLGNECDGKKCMFDGWYLDNGERWTGYVESDLTVYANWLPFEDLVVTKNDITFTIMDRNLGATSSGTGCTNSNNSVCGYYFQWGNNYGFKYNVNDTSSLINGEINLSEKAADWEGHISTYYNGIWRTENPWTDGNFGGASLWGYSKSSNLDIDKQGPCPYGYHVPSVKELNAVYSLFGNSNIITNNLKLSSKIWSSTPYGSDNAYFFDSNISQGGLRVSGLAVRCFKNEENKTIRFETNGGNSLQDGKTAKRWEKSEKLPGAKKTRNKFLGRYLNPDFFGDSIETNYIYEDSDGDEITLYAKWEECGDGYMESIDGTKCVSLDTLEIDAIDGGKITIMKENLGKSENLGWNERDKGPCPKGYHVPTMQERNTLFLSWCEKHTILDDGLCDVRNLDRQSYESDKDFIYVPFNSDVARAFGEELSLVFREHNNDVNSEMYMIEEYNEYYKDKCEEIEMSCGSYEENSQCWAQYDYEYTYYCNEYLTDELKEIFQYGIYGGVLGAYWTSSPYIEKRFGETSLGSSYFYINTIKGRGYLYNPLFWNTLNNEEIPVRCFKDDYVASDRMILLDLIEESDLDEYKEFEQKIRLGELELPEDKQEEVVMLMLMDGNVKYSILGFLKNFVFGIEEYGFEECNDEDKDYIQSLKSLLNEVINVTDENKSEVINHVSVFDWSGWNGFNFMYDSYELQAVVEYYLGMSDDLFNQEFEDQIDDAIISLKNGVDDLFNDYDFFTESDKDGLYAAFEDLKNYQSNDDIVIFLGILRDEAFDLLDKYESEIGSSRVSKLKSFFSFVYSLSEVSLNITELDGFIKEAEAYLGTNDWILGYDGLIDYQEMVTQEYLQEEFAKMGYRVILTSEMSADEIRDKIENIKGINFESDEYLALIGINGEEIDIDDGIKNNNRGYVKVKKKPLKEGRSSGGGGISISETSDNSFDDGKNENPTENSVGIENDSQLGESDINNSFVNDDLELSNLSNFGGDINNSLVDSQGLQQYSPEYQQAYKFAKENGITTMVTIQDAKMEGKLTRIQMAKMLSQYAINVLGEKPDTTKNVKFKDVTNKMDERYDNGVTLAYQLGIMGQNMPRNRFRPNDEVSRAEFVTALSRMLYQTSDGEYEKTSKYYMPHMAKLYNEGIVNDTNPGMKERRGYVMIMLMRSVNNG